MFGIVSICLLLAIIVFRFVFLSMSATEQTSSQEMNNLLFSAVGSLITFVAIFFILNKWGSNITFLSNKSVAIFLIIISLVILFLFISGWI